MRTWREKDHPRDGEGQFREKWASKISDRIGLPSVKDLLRDPTDRHNPEVARQLEGRYGSGGMIVRNVGVSRLGGDYRSTMTPEVGGHLDISGEIASDSDPHNLDNGYFRATISHGRENFETDPLRWSAHIDRMHVRGGAQGGGGGRELTNRLIDWFRQSGVDEVTVGPSEIGSYAWGAMGFDFHDLESRRIAWEGAMTLTVQRVRDWFRYNGHSYGLGDGSQLSDAQIKKMAGQYRRAATVALAGGMSYQRLSQYGRKPGQGKDDWWAGKLGLIVGGVGGGRIKL